MADEDKTPRVDCRLTINGELAERFQTYMAEEWGGSQKYLVSSIIRKAIKEFLNRYEEQKAKEGL